MTTTMNNREVDVAKRMRPTVSKTVPVHIGSDTVTWSGSGASLAASIEGAKLGDIVIATIQDAPTQAAYLVSAKAGEGSITFTLSAANTSDDAVIAYSIFR